MASCPNDENRGYESLRFENPVDDNFHCGICYNVVKDARSCRDKEHIFCRDCIEQHLRVNAQRCPECQEELTVATLRPARIVNNFVSKLRIKCDYASRGCPEFTTVEDLQTHVKNCDFAPIWCSNEHCRAIINKRDRIHHETNECRHRRMSLNDCQRIEQNVRNVKDSLKAHDDKVTTLVQQTEHEIKEEMRAKFAEVNKRMDEKLDVIRNHQDEQFKETQRSIKKVQKEMTESKQEMKDVKRNLSAVTKDVDEVKAMMRQMLRKMNMEEQLVHKLPSPTGRTNTEREDFVNAGGDGLCYNTHF